MEKFCITIASLPDRERLVAEIFYDGVQWAEISQETDEVAIQFYSHPRKKYWEFSYDEAIQILEKAKNKLLEIYTKDSDGQKDVSVAIGIKKESESDQK